MQYQGGKNKLARYLAPIIAAAAEGCHTYIEPFMGSCAVLCAVAPLLPSSVTRLVGADAHEDLVLMWKRAQEGGKPPAVVTEAEYQALKHAEPSALRGFVGYACSFGGKWFGGYARARSGYDYTGLGRRTVISKGAVLSESAVELYHCGYAAMGPLIEPGVIVYADPPYASTLSYKATGAFDSDLFWCQMEAWSDAGAIVLVSEFAAPPGWHEVWSLDRHNQTDNVNGSIGKRVVDKLFARRPVVAAPPGP